MSIFQIVTLQAADGKADDLRPMLEDGRDFARAADGCEGIEIYRSTDDPNRFTMIERWASVEQHQRHFQTNLVESGVLDRVGAVLACPM